MRKEKTVSLQPPAPGPTGCTPAEAEAFLAEHPEVEQIQLILTDACGVARGKQMSRRELARVYAGGRMLAGSVMGMDITGTDVEEAGLLWEDGDADRVAWPIPGTLTRAPWLEVPTAQLIATMYELDRRPMLADPRHALAGVVARFEELGLTPVVAVETEFYLLDADHEDMRAPRPARSRLSGHRPRHPQGYSLTDLDDFGPFVAEVSRACEMLGLEADTAIAEYAPGQMEIVLRHRADALRVGDEAVLLKRIVKGTAGRHGCSATFMAKPFAEWSGSGMHVHVSLVDRDGYNIFASEDPAGSEQLRHALAGMLAILPDSVGILAPTGNAYRRFQPHSYAPIRANWGVNNRSVSLRVTAGPADSRHIEHRVAGADANPYLALATVLAGAHHGLVNRLDPGAPVSGNGYDSSAPVLPTNWYTALERTEHCAVLKDYLGTRFMDVFCAIKNAERERFYAQLTLQDYHWYQRTA